MSNYNRFEAALRRNLQELIESIGHDLKFEVPANVRENIIDRTVDSIAALTVAGYAQSLGTQILAVRDEHYQVSVDAKDRIGELPDIADD